MTKRVIAYLRDSGGPDQQLSINQQLEQVGIFCRDQAYSLVRTYKDTASGGSTVGRFQFLAMIDHLHQVPPPVDLVVFWAYSRFARDYDDNQYYLADIRRLGIDIISITDTIPEGLDGRLLESIFAWKDAKYRRDLSRDVSRALRYLMEHHRAWHGGRPPTGYIAIKEPIAPGSDRLVSRLVPDPQQASLVLRAFDMRANGYTLREIQEATRLVASKAATGRLLKNPIYIGTAKMNGKLYPNFCEPIVPQAIWDLAQRVGSERNKKHGYNHPRTIRSEFILTGLLNCGVCGKSMNGRIASNKYGTIYKYYRCQSESLGQRCGAKLVPHAALEKIVIDDLCAHLVTINIGSMVTKIKKMTNEQAAGMERDLQHERSILDDTNKSIDRVISAITATGHSAALLESLENLENQRDQTHGTISLLESQIQTLTPDINPEHIKAQYLQWSEILPGTDIRTRRMILQKTIGTITAHRQADKKIICHIDYRFDLLKEIARLP